MRKLLIITLVLFIPFGLISQDQVQHLQKVGQKLEIMSEVLGETRTVYVQFPDSYSAGSSVKYPVAYVLDGELLLPTLNIVHSYYSGGFIPEMIMVGIANDHDRNRDLTTSEVKMMYGSPAPENGKAANFLRFIGQELIPYMEDHYPVSDYRTLIGHSYGGLFTLFSLLKQPELFANYLAIDPSLDWDEQQLSQEAEALLASGDYQGRSLYITLNGQLHMQKPSVTIDNLMEDESPMTLFARANVTFANLVRKNQQNGLEFGWKHYPRDLHGTIPLPSMMDGLISIFEWFQMEQVEKFNDFETPIRELEALIEYRANKLKKRFGYEVAPYPEDLVNAMCYMSMDMGKHKKAKMFLDAYIRYFPKSANAYDAMADYYIRQKQPAEALKYATNAYEMSGSDFHKKKMEELKQ